MDDLAGKFMRAAVLWAMAAMLLGLFMAISEDHGQKVAHAHAVLIGWASMALYGLFYRAWPHAAADRFARWHFWVANLSVLVLAPALVALYAGIGAADPFAAVSSIGVLAGMALFAVIVWRATARAA